MADTSSESAKQKDAAALLARNPLVASACELDLLLFLYRHPRTLLTNEQLSAYVGYDMKLIARAIDAFVGAGLLERTQNPNHAARMYLLQLDGQPTGELKILLEFASTRQGRRDVLQILDPTKSRPTNAQVRRMRAIA